ncbi:DUF6498-containing protein [Haloplanus halobius]|uniref:DUF6498-containing protein n=1 Tax=Haloplanus halobius TaxID=2934938 RepID=UPI00200EC3E2|nr:DUF6498-containing protein [Haloplanus sp. XH21]
MTDRRLPLLAVIGTNAIPLVGVGFLGWSIAALIVVYWVELGVGLGFAALRATFAQRPPEHDADLLLLGAFRHKRGSVAVPWIGPDVQVANIPILIVLFPVFGAIWFVTGGIALGGTDVAIAGDPFDADTMSTAALGIIGIVISRGVETMTEYFLNGQYESVSVQGALQTAIWPIMVVGLALTVSGAAATSGAPATVILVALVSTKLLFDLAEVYRDRLVAFDERSALDFGWANTPDSRSTIDAELQDHVDIVRPRWSAVFVDGVIRGLRTEAVGLTAFVVGLSLLFGALGTNPELVLFGSGVGLAILVFVGLCGVVDGLVRYSAMEYRLGRDMWATIDCSGRHSGGFLGGNWSVVTRIERSPTVCSGRGRSPSITMGGLSVFRTFQMSSSQISLLATDIEDNGHSLQLLSFSKVVDSDRRRYVAEIHSGRGYQVSHI